MYDAETIERYRVIERTQVCPDCGSDCERVKLGELLSRLGDRPEDGEDPESTAFVCSHADCKYAICIGERAEAAA